MAPIRTDGMAMIRQPSPPTNDRYLAVPTVFADRTLWKYTCHGSPPNMSRRKESMYTPTNTGSTSWIHTVEELTDMLSTKSFVKANGTQSHWNEKFEKCVKKYYRGRMYRLFLVRWFRCHCFCVWSSFDNRLQYEVKIYVFWVRPEKLKFHVTDVLSRN